MGRLEALRRRRSVILGYHGIARSPLRRDLNRLQVPPSRFRAQIEALVDAGFKFVTVAELARLAAGREPPPGYAAISFDDAMRSTFTAAWPALRKYDIRATVYVTIPQASRDDLDLIVGACTDAGVTCRFVRRDTDLEPSVVLGAVAE